MRAAEGGAAVLAPAVEPLLNWYDKNHRQMPWRSDPTPYHVWVSEIMLQQTRVEAATPYYLRFIDALPDIACLALAPEERLLKLWEGLGYYSRVRNLQKAARQVMEQWGGRLPDDPVQLQTLPGIGPYTAAAIASIAYGRPAAAVDGNVLRVFSRLLASREDIAQGALKRSVTGLVQQLAPASRAGDYTQSLMELGATVCLPGGPPLCDVCPLAPWCEARRLGVQMELPVKAAPKPRRIEQQTVVVLRAGERVLVQKRPKGGLLAGLYQPLLLPGTLTKDQVKAALCGLGLDPLELSALAPAKHIFSHLEWQMTGWLATVGDDARDGEGQLAAVSCSQVDSRYPVPGAFKAYKPWLIGAEKGAHKEEAEENG